MQGKRQLDSKITCEMHQRQRAEAGRGRYAPERYGGNCIHGQQARRRKVDKPVSRDQAEQPRSTQELQLELDHLGRVRAAPARRRRRKRYAGSERDVRAETSGHQVVT